MKPKVLLFGDEVTAGFDPAAPLRYLPEQARYYAALRDRYELVVDASKTRPLLLAGSPEACLLELDAVLSRHRQTTDCVVVQLGTRDLATADYGFDLVNGLNFLAQCCRRNGVRCLVVGHPGTQPFSLPVDLALPKKTIAQKREKWERVSREYLDHLCDLQCPCLDLRGHREFLGEDGLHFTAACQQALGGLVAAKIDEVLAQ